MERGVQRKLHAPCEWGEKPEAESQGLTYPYPTSAVILNPALCPSTPTAQLAWNGSAPEASGRIGTASRLPVRSYTSTGAETALPTMWELWNPVMEVSSTPSRGTLIMPANSSVMPWGIGGYWGMVHSKLRTVFRTLYTSSYL